MCDWNFVPVNDKMSLLIQSFLMQKIFSFYYSFTDQIFLMQKIFSFYMRNTIHTDRICEISMRVSIDGKINRINDEGIG